MRVPSFRLSPTHCALVACVLVACALWVSSAVAQSSADVAAEADVLFELGVQAQRDGNYREAVAYYFASERLSSNSNVRFNLAVALEHIERYAEAYAYYNAYLGEATSLTSSERRELNEALARLRRRVGLVRVTTDPQNASVYLDRVDLGVRGQSPFVIAVPRGRHRIIARLDGYLDAQSEEFAASPGEEVVVTISLTPNELPALLRGAPEGSRYRYQVGGHEVEGEVSSLHALPEGRRVLEVSCAGYQPRSIAINVAASSALESNIIDATLSAEPGSLSVTVDDALPARVFVDDNSLGFTPFSTTTLASGSHRLRIERDGFRSIDEEFLLTPETPQRLEYVMHRSDEFLAATRDRDTVADAPASVSIVDARDIHAFGYQTIYEAVAGQRGFYQTDDRSYSSLGVRGLSEPSDYGNRILVTVDGHSMNDDLLGSSYVGYDARLDLIDVERIEIVRGPGSALYGTNAFLGVLNLVTRDAQSRLRPHISFAGDSTRLGRARIGGSAVFGRNTGITLSAGGAYSMGEDVEVQGRTVRDSDGFSSGFASARFWHEDMTIAVQLNHRSSQTPTGAFDTLVGDSRNRVRDTRGYFELRYQPARLGNVLVFARAYADLYLYSADYPYVPPTGVSRERWDGSWVGAELRANYAFDPALNATLGVDGRASVLGNLQGQNDSGTYLSTTAESRFASAYALLNWRPGNAWLVTGGARMDYVSIALEAAVSPRASIIYRPWSGGSLKLLAGNAFRAPSPYELRYNDGGVTQLAPASLHPERVNSAELEFSQRLSDLSFSVNAFANLMENRITTVRENLDGDPEEEIRYRNSPATIFTVGAEFEARYELSAASYLAATYSFQRTRISDLGKDALANLVANSPEHLASVRLLVPIVPELLLFALRLRVESPRTAIQDTTFSQSAIPVMADIVLSGEVRALRVSYNVGLRNALDWRYAHPGGDQVPDAFVVQPGRTFFFQSTLAF